MISFIYVYRCPIFALSRPQAIKLAKGQASYRAPCQGQQTDPGHLRQNLPLPSPKWLPIGRSSSK